MRNKDYLSNEAGGVSVGRGRAVWTVAEVGSRSLVDGGTASSEGNEWTWMFMHVETDRGSGWEERPARDLTAAPRPSSSPAHPL